MLVREILPEEKEQYNQKVSHPVQTWEWGDFKKTTGVEVERIGLYDGKNLISAYQLTLHSIPKTNFTIGYFPKGPLPNEQMLQALVNTYKKKNVIYIKLEPNIQKKDEGDSISTLQSKFDLRKAKDIFTPNTFLIDLTKSEEKLLAQMKEKTRYNLRLAQQNGVIVEEDNSNSAFESYIKLTQVTAKRQKFYTHNEEYHRKMWEVLNPAGIAHLLTAKWNGEILAAWILFVYKNVLYYPYGASSSENRNLMSSNLMMWEAMRFGKNIGCHTFDLWGSLGINPNKKDPWYGFHRFKEGYGGNLVEFLGAYDLVLNPKLYLLAISADKLRWKWLRFISKFR